ncbi:MAG: YdcF family protein [Magnetococcales bacterium]|nr:YdcF family protein [Magnetococcales bacterium]
MNTQTIRIIEWMLLPPGVTILLLLVVIYTLNNNKKGYKNRDNKSPFIIWLAIFSLYFMSINYTANSLTSLLERPDIHPPLTIEQIKTENAQAIIILGHGRYPKAPEYNNEDTLNTGGLARARYGAKLHRETGLPILLAGGSPYGESNSEASIMKKVLENEFNVPVRWLEERSKNTYENALYSSQLLKKENIKRVLMVTHSRDIIRALGAFEKVGILQVTPAPTLFGQKPTSNSIKSFTPNPYALSRNAVALHELAGMYWYNLRYGVK